MKRIDRVALGMKINLAVVSFAMVGMFVLPSSASAKTEQFDFTMYGVDDFKAGEESKTPGGLRRIVNSVGQTTILDSNTGERSSEWCYIEILPDAVSPNLATIGHCTAFYDDGSLLFMSLTWRAGDDKSGRWTVLGGTGRYAGASGGGTSETLSRSADGKAWTGRGSGTIEIP